MLIAVQIPKNNETIALSEPDQTVRLTHVSFSENKPQTANLFALWKNQKFLIASLNSETSAQTKIRMDFISSENVKLVSEGADLNVFGFVNILEEIYQDEEDFSDEIYDEKESESELEIGSIRPYPPANWDNVMRQIETQKNKAAFYKIEQKNTANKAEKNKQRKIKKQAKKNEKIKINEKSNQGKSEIKMDGKIKEKKSVVKNEIFQSEITIEIKKEIVKSIPNVNTQLGKMGMWSDKKKR